LDILLAAALSFLPRKKWEKFWQKGKMGFPGFLGMYEGKRGKKITLPEVMQKCITTLTQRLSRNTRAIR
jgi:hypothetical protein